MNKDEMLKQYASLIVKVGANVKKGQKVILNCDASIADFAALVAEAAYDCGAADVFTDLTSVKIDRLRMLRGEKDLVTKVCPYYAEKLNALSEEGAAYIRVLSPDPEGFAGVDPLRMSALVKSKKESMSSFFKNQDTGKMRWTIAAYPSEKWAAKVYPNEPIEKSVELLTKDVFDAARANGDYLKNWESHNNTLKTKREELNSLSLDYVTLKSEKSGTDVKIGLLDGGIWAGGEATGIDGTVFNPNIPTEETFTTPNRLKIDGKIVSTKPLCFQGKIIDDFYIQLEKGRIVSYGAKIGEDVLSSIIEADEGSHFLGELALIPVSSPISKMEKLFYTTLFDENASCHVAIGEGFSECIEGGFKMSQEELLKNGVNDSCMHVDFMIGTDDMEIVGYKKDGSRVPIFKKGEWA